MAEEAEKYSERFVRNRSEVERGWVGRVGEVREGGAARTCAGCVRSGSVRSARNGAADRWMVARQSWVNRRT